MHKCVTDIIRRQRLWSYDQTALYKSIIIIIIKRRGKVNEKVGINLGV